MNKLSQYLDRTGKRQEDFAAEVDAAQSTVSGWKTGASRPRLPKAIKIERVTGGEVPVSSWHEEE